jgi:hypothetical protein
MLTVTYRIISDHTMWWNSFKSYLNSSRGVDDWRTLFRSHSFSIYLSDYLHHKDGAQNKHNFKFETDLLCNEPAPRITAMKLGVVQFRQFKSKVEHVPARAVLAQILSEVEMPSHTFSESRVRCALRL